MILKTQNKILYLIVFANLLHFLYIKSDTSKIIVQNFLYN